MTDQAIPRTDTLGERASNGKLAHLYRNWKARRQIRLLQDRDEKILDDIGVTRDELSWASRLPLTVNAAIALKDVSYRRRKEQQLMWL